MSRIEDVLRARLAQGSPISMVTCYDAGFSGLCQEAKIDLLLVGDSLANVVLGYSRTAEIGMPEMLHHTAAVRRGSSEAVVVADMPFGADATPELALENGLALQRAGADAVKLEGGKFEAVRALVSGGVPVMGHLGLLPQTATSLKQTGRDAAEAKQILSDAKGLEAAGACSLVLEHVPSALAAEVTAALSIATIGIGAGPHCSGQVLVLHDMLGLTARRPPFVRAFADLRSQVLKGLTDYDQAVKDHSFPA